MNNRHARVLQKRFVIFCEGDTEYNYIENMRRKQGVELVLKPINMGGGGYANFLKKIRIEPQSNCLAKFIIIDADRFIAEPSELINFKALLEYCRIQNTRGGAPYFLIVDNPDFEYVACLHSPDYKGQDIHRFLMQTYSIAQIRKFKSDKNVYTLLNNGSSSYSVMVNNLRGRKKIVRNEYEIIKKTFEINIRKTYFDMNMSTVKCSNIEEFFDVIDW